MSVSEHVQSSTKSAKHPSSNKRRAVASRITKMLDHDNLSNLFPQQAISDDGLVFFSDFHVGLMYVGMPASGADETTVRRLHSALNSEMPPGTIISFHLLNTPHINEQIAQYVNAREGVDPAMIRLDPLVKDLPQKRAEFFRRMSRGEEADQVTESNTACLIVSVKVPCSAWPIPEDERRATLEVGATISEACAAAFIPVVVCDAPTYLMLFRRILRPFEPLDYTYSPRQLLSNQVLRPGSTVDATATEVILDDEVYVRQLQPFALPDEMSLAFMAHLPGDPGGLSNQIRCPFMISTVLHYPDRGTKTRYLRSKRNKLLYQAMGPIRKWNTKIDRMLSGLDLLTSQIDTDNDLPVEMSFSILLFHKDLEQIARESSRVMSFWGGFNFQMAAERNITFPSFWNSLPAMATSESIVNSFRFNTVPSTCAVHFLPILGEWQGSATASMTLLSTRRGKPYIFDLFDPANTNYSAVLYAESGAGKSVLAQQLATDHLSLGGILWILDIGYSYRKLCSLLGGEYIEFKRDSPVNCNPFLYVEDIDDSMEVLRTVIGKMIAPQTGLDDLQRGYVEEAIKSCWARYNTTTTPTEIAEYLRKLSDPRAQDLSTMMFPWTRQGSFGAWFQGSKPIDFNNQFTVLEMIDLREMPQLLDVLLVMLINRINAKMRSDATNPQRANKLIIADESWDLLNNEGTAKYLAAAARTLRKERGGIVPITQSIADLYASPAGRAIASNAATQIVMSQKEESISYVREQKMLSLSDYWWDQLKTVHTRKGRFSEVMFINRLGVGIARLQIDTYMQAVYSTEGAARTEILRDIDHGVPAREAIANYLERAEK